MQRLNLLTKVLASRAAVAALVLVLCASVLTVVAASREPPQPPVLEIAERDGIKREVKRLFAGGDFDAVIRMARSLRETKARTASGIWKLSVLYGAFHELATIDPADDAAWKRLDAGLDGLLLADPTDPTPYIARGIALKRYAWEIRPRTFVQQASTGGGDDAFMAALERARTYLEANRGIASRDPHFYVLRADVGSALAEPPDKLIGLIEEGLDKTPDYYQLYFSGLDYFAPTDQDASGTEEARRIEAFANMAVSRTRGSEGLGVYARLYWHAYSAVYGEGLFTRSQVDWARMRQGIDDVLQRYPDAWNVNNFAYLACLEGDRDETQRLIELIGDAPIASVWPMRGLYARCRDWAQGRTASARR